jgi:hypothetical protein
MTGTDIDWLCVSLRRMAAEHGEEAALAWFNRAMAELCFRVMDRDPEQYARVIAHAQRCGVPLRLAARRRRALDS